MHAALHIFSFISSCMHATLLINLHLHFLQQMTIIGMNLRFSPSILQNPDHKTYRYPIGTRRLPNRVGRIFSSGHKENQAENVEVEREEVKLLWDDGHGSQTFEDYIKAAKCMLKSDGGPPRWFCPVEAGPPLKNSPLLLYLPGIDGLGMGMMLHHKAMGKVFEVRCMHIPVGDRTTHEGLVKFVENVVRDEHALCPNKPVYLVGDSFGACIALSVSASNPAIDLVLILVNPATSFNRSNLHHLIPLLEAFPQELQVLLPYILATTLGDPIKMANKIMNGKKLINSPAKHIENLIHRLSASISFVLGDDHKQSLIWKLKLLKSGAAYANSRIHAVKCEALILASGKDFMLPSKDEAERLTDIIKKSRVRFFKNSGHTLLLEDGINLLTVIKGLCMYRRSRKRDPILDFVPPSQSEFQDFFDQQFRWFRFATSPVVLSTLGDGEIVRGLKGIPEEGPVLLVGYHMLFGSEISTIVEEFLREKHVMVHGLAHPEIFTKTFENTMQNISSLDYMKVFGAVPVTARNFLRLLSTKSYVLLYPGGVREALHRKGEAYKLFWPEDPEFVRMAIKCKAKIVPFGVVGEDDLIELFFDYNDMMRIPLVKDMIKEKNANLIRVRDAAREKGEVSNQDFFVPGALPKLPGRFYFLFGKAVVTEGRGELLKDNAGVKDLYLQIKCEVERNMAYLIKKREEDPYRHVFERLMHRVISSINAPQNDTPTFEP